MPLKVKSRTTDVSPGFVERFGTILGLSAGLTLAGARRISTASGAAGVPAGVKSGCNPLAKTTRSTMMDVFLLRNMTLPPIGLAVKTMRAERCRYGRHWAQRPGVCSRSGGCLLRLSDFYVRRLHFGLPALLKPAGGTNPLSPLPLQYLQPLLSLMPVRPTRGKRPRPDKKAKERSTQRSMPSSIGIRDEPSPSCARSTSLRAGFDAATQMVSLCSSFDE